MKTFVSTCLLILFSLIPVHAKEQPSEFDWGFLASRKTDVNGDMRLRMAGPFFESVVSTNDQKYWALRPVYGIARDPNKDKRYSEFIWPVAQSYRFGNMFQRRFLLIYYRDFDTGNPKSRYYFRVFPLYFQGRDKKGEGYVALFPIGGSIHSYLMRDKIDFFLWPIWSRTEIHGIVSKNYLWPIYNSTKGTNIQRTRVFPFYGRYYHKGNYEHRFIMWPIYTWSRFRHPGNEGRGYVIFPLWGHISRDREETWMFLPPLTRFTKGTRMNYMYCPWPIIQASWGEIEKFYVWPIWGHKKMAGIEKSFFLWPITGRETTDRGATIDRRSYIFPVWHSDVRKTRESNSTGKVVYRNTEVWPLMKYHREGDVVAARILDLWPFKDTPPVERCYAPLWTVYSYARNRDAVNHEILWGLYSYRRNGLVSKNVSLFPLFSWKRNSAEEGEKEWDVLKGLIGYKRDGTQSEVRLLYWIRF